MAQSKALVTAERGCSPRWVVPVVVVLSLIVTTAVRDAEAIEPEVWIQVAAVDGLRNDQFGMAVALDANTLVVGSPGVGDSAGSVYVFTWSEGAWLQQQKLITSDGDIGDRFGEAVGVSGNTLVAGAPGDDEAYVFIRSGSVWSQQQRLVAADAGSPSRFGTSVAISGDTVIVGAPTPYVGGPYSELDTGFAYVFVRTVDVWAQQQKLTPSDGASGDVFGGAVSLSGDTVIVGATGDDDHGAGSGSAYVFTRSGGVWSEEQKLGSSDGAPGDQFGVAVDVSGGFAVSAAHRDDDLGDESGAVYTFTRLGGVWSEEQKLKASDGATLDFFGTTVDVSGDSLAVGSDGGAGYLFERDGGPWSEQAVLQVPAFTNSGHSPAAVSPDFAVVGGPYLDGHRGSVFVFESEPGIRYSGWDRYQTAVAVSEGHFDDPNAVSTVFVATGESFPDALVGASLAGTIHAPLLLVRPTEIPAPVRSELVRLGPATIIILGGPSAVSDAVVSELASLPSSPATVRLAGPDRYATAVAVSQYQFPVPSTVETVVIASGMGYADALAAATLGASLDGPVLLTGPDHLPGVVTDEINRLAPSKILVVGGPNAIASDVVAELQELALAVDRVAGPDRYSTAVAISHLVFGGADRVYVVTGLDFPDAVSAAVVAVMHGVPILMVPGDTVPPAVAAEIVRLGANDLRIVGGTGVVSHSVAMAIGGLLAP